MSSIDGIIHSGSLSGTIIGLVSRTEGDPIRVEMVDSRYCVLGNVKDICRADPSFKGSDDNFNPGEND